MYYSPESGDARHFANVQKCESVSERVFEHCFALFEHSLNSYPRKNARSRVKRFSNTHREENSLSDPTCDFILLLIILNAQQEECTNNEQTKKESTSEKSGEREDGFEGRERRTCGVVFEDS